MAFEFSPKDRKVQSGARRIACEELDQALARLDTDLVADVEAVHALRKATKKLRGLLRLIRPTCAVARAETAALRDAARRIAALRETDVMIRTLETLAKALPAEDMTRLRAILDTRRDAAAEPEALSDAVAGLRAEFQEMRARSRRWKLRGEGFEALEPGLIETWKRCRKGLRRARSALDAPDLPAQAFHAWRKDVKHHWYQARLLAPIWPEMMTVHVAQSDALGEVLGDHNDLDVLLATLAAEENLQEGPVLARLRDAVMARRQVLARQAVATGARLFAEPADALADRWGRWWRLWRA